MTPAVRRTRLVLVAIVSVVLAVAAAVAVNPIRASALTRQEAIATLAFDNVGKKACSTNSKGGKGFETSCTGYTGHGPPQYWCADFAKWVWAKNGVKDTGVLNAAAYSFYTYAQKHGGVHAKPRLGDVAIFSNSKGNRSSGSSGINHVAIVGGWSASGAKVHTVSGDWINNPPSGLTEAQFASRSHVVDNGPDYPSAPGSHPAAMDMWIIGYVSPVL